MEKRTVRIIAFLVAVILLFSLVGCSREPDSRETKAPSNTTVPITTESITPTQATTLPATTEAQTEPPTTEPAVDISDVVWVEDNLDGAKYLIPKDWERKDSEDGSKTYVPTQLPAVLLTFSKYTPADFFDKYDLYRDDIKRSIQADFEGFDIVSTDSEKINKNTWECIRLESEESEERVDYRYHATNNGIIFVLSLYSEDSDMLPTFLAIQDRIIESVDFSSFYIKRPLSSLMDLEPGIVLVDNQYVKITFEGITYDDTIFMWYPLKIDLLIENKTDQSIGVQVRDLSINDFMCNAYLAPSIAAKKKAMDSITFLPDDINKLGLTDPYELVNLEWSFIVYYETDYVPLETTPVKLTIYD